jgi:choice-of-anchor A domain-containing protein
MQKFPLFLVFLFVFVHCTTASSSCSIIQVLAQSCNGNGFNGTNFNLLSFGSLDISTGNINGQVAVRNDLTAGNGFAFGFSYIAPPVINRIDEWSLVVGGNAITGTGSIFPANSPIFVGSIFRTNETDFLPRVSRCGTGGCLDNNPFDILQNCFINVASSIPPQNVVFSPPQYGTFDITCLSNALFYQLDINSTLFNQVSLYQLHNCNPNAAWTINILGGDVTFQGDSFPAVGGGVLYVIAGPGRNVNVDFALVNGNILAPQSNFIQVGGNIFGNVIVGNAASVLSLDLPLCPQV